MNKNEKKINALEFLRKNCSDSWADKKVGWIKYNFQNTGWSFEWICELLDNQCVDYYIDFDPKNYHDQFLVVYNPEDHSEFHFNYRSN